MNKIKAGNNVPIQAPLIPDPLIPYHCKHSKTIFAIVEVDEGTLRRYLAPSPFEYVNNQAMIYVNDFMESPELPYRDSGIVVQVEYQGTRGGHYLFEYENDDEAIAAGRELWGYPKKYAHIEMQQEDSVISGSATRRGTKLIEITCDLSNAPTEAPPRLQVFPHLNVQTIPRPDGPGIWAQRIIMRDNSADCTLLSEEFGEVTVQLSSGDRDPLGDFIPTRILGGGYTVTNFTAGTTNGWGHVLDTLI